MTMMTEGPDDDGVGYTSGTLADGRVGADVGGKVYGMLEPSVEIHPYVGAGKFVEHSPSLTVITTNTKGQLNSPENTIAAYNEPFPATSSATAHKAATRTKRPISVLQYQAACIGSDWKNLMLCKV